MPCLSTNYIFSFLEKKMPLTSGTEKVSARLYGAIAQLGERLPCTQEVSGSIPLSSTIYVCLQYFRVYWLTVCCEVFCSLTIRNKLKI